MGDVERGKKGGRRGVEEGTAGHVDGRKMLDGEGRSKEESK